MQIIEPKPNRFDPNHSFILVTGGSGGFGRSLISLLCSEGFSVMNWDKVPPAEKVKNEIFLELDLTSIFQIETACENLRKEFFPVTASIARVPKHLVGYVHAAGYGGPYHAITEVSVEEWDAIFSTNLRSAFQITKAILPGFSSQKFGRLVYLASSLALKGSAHSVAYSSSKHGLIGFVKSIAAEWGEFGITSNAVSPGYMETKMGIQEDQVNDHRNRIIEMTPSKKIADPIEVARVVRFLLTEAADYVNGANWTIDGGITAI
ncbi:3-ketoacyl-ACP reductase [Leptospira perolatii]|uniref:3-ketoacyl-ACP reductase n=1 Tax=Leptospira perolatii TaxID=2023191 RepID=A0A2M9ZP92_9LEPT|nr:SDR family oxidoreductase [Leptospira perolatii]PJZ70676.1 3-ketoacyl-ACP reductase [Leptospira perolatii]PJZ73887.1 3-ketoacyl-ACP reductase [Leptospira perolatii]